MIIDQMESVATERNFLTTTMILPDESVFANPHP